MIRQYILTAILLCRMILPNYITLILAIVFLVPHMMVLLIQWNCMVSMQNRFLILTGQDILTQELL